MDQDYLQTKQDDDHSDMPNEPDNEGFLQPDTEQYLRARNNQQNGLVLANLNIQQLNNENSLNAEDIGQPNSEKITPGELFKQIKQERQKQRSTHLNKAEKSDFYELKLNEVSEDELDETNESTLTSTNLLQDDRTFRVADVYYMDFDRPDLIKPWQENKECLSDYFNYGFDEQSFKIYQSKVQNYVNEKLELLKSDQEFRKIIPPGSYIRNHPTLNFYLPHEFGGCGAPFYESQKYNMFNVYTPQMDLALIKPCWTNKNEFKVDLPRNINLDYLQTQDEDDNLNFKNKKNENHLTTKNPESIIQHENSENKFQDKVLDIASKKGQEDYALSQFPQKLLQDFKETRLKTLTVELEKARKEKKEAEQILNKIKQENKKYREPEQKTSKDYYQKTKYRRDNDEYLSRDKDRHYVNDKAKSDKRSYQDNSYYDKYYDHRRDSREKRDSRDTRDTRQTRETRETRDSRESRDQKHWRKSRSPSPYKRQKSPKKQLRDILSKN